MILREFSYVVVPEGTGRTAEDAAALLLANAKSATLAHVREVAQVCAQLAERFGIDREGCVAAGLLHDISAVIRREDMLLYARRQGFALCEAEERLPFLLHQRLSRVVAQEHFGVTDESVLSAIECHTTLRAQASPMDMALFLADKLAWDQPGVPPYETEVRAALERSLPAACHAFMRYSNENGRVLFPHVQWIEAFDWLGRTLPEADR